MQSIVLRKILETFRILSITTIKIEAKLFSTYLRLQQKCDKYAIKLATLTKNYLTRIYISSFFILQYSIEIEINKRKYLNWNKNKSIESIDANLSNRFKNIAKKIENIRYKCIEC